MLLGGVAAATAASGFTAWKLWPSDSGIRSLAVLPFENPAQDDDAEFLCNGLTDSLIRQITALPALTVKRGGVFKGKKVDPQAAGRQLGVDAIVSGSVTRRSGQLRITAELADVRTGAVLWSGKYDRDEADLLPIQDQIASAILDEGIRLKLSEADRRRLVQHSTNDREANELYLRAIFYEAKETEGDYLTARKLLLEAIGKDKNFARAFGALARNYVIMAVDGYAPPTEAWPLVKLYAEKALVLDPTLLEAKAGLGAEAFWNQWNWSLAEQQYETALQSALGRSLMGYVLERWAVGRPDDALRLIRKVRAVDPLDLAWKLREADMLLRTAQTQTAAQIYEEIIHDSPDDPRAYFGLAEVRNTQKQFDRAIAQLRLGYAAKDETDDSLLEVLAKARGAEGYRQAEKAGAQIELEALAARAAANLYVSPLDFARAHARLGHTEKVFDYIDAAFAGRAPGLVFLKVDHVWDSIRNEQRFRDAVKKVGLP
jgi:TolB-like protein/Tfp pilus assembly protein PilF